MKGDFLLPDQVTRGVYRIAVPIPTAYSPVNVYFLPGKVPTLVDAAFNTPDAWEYLQGEVRAAGLDISGIKQVILTHGHVDHCGLTERIRAVSGANVVLHPKEWAGVQAFQDPSPELDALMEKQFRLWGIPETFVLKIVGFRQRLREICRVSAEGLQMIEDGEALPAGDYELRAVHCPGHTPGQLVWYAEKEKLAFTGDHVLKTISPNPDLYMPPQNGSWSGLPDYMESLAKVAGFDVKLALPGHGVEITDLPGRVNELRQSHAERKMRILQLFEGGSLTLSDLTLRFLADIGRQPDGPIFFLGLRETLGHLYLLAGDGLLIREEDGEAVRYRPKNNER